MYDAKSSLLVTAGFDSAIKVHQMYGFLSRGLHGHAEVKEFIDRTEILTIRIPNTSEHCGLTDRYECFISFSLRIPSTVRNS